MAHPKSVLKPQRHIVVAVAVITNTRNEILICLRNDPRNPDFDRHWEFPGGTIQRGETIEQGLAREVQEEIACSIHIHEIIPHVRLTQRDGSRKNLSIFVLSFHATITAGVPRCDGREILEYRWVSAAIMKILPCMPGMGEIVDTLYAK